MANVQARTGNRKPVLNLNNGEEEDYGIGQSLSEMAMRRLRRDGLTLLAIVVLGIITLLSILAPVISTSVLGVDYSRTDIINAFLPVGGIERLAYTPDVQFKNGNIYSVVFFDKSPGMRLSVLPMSISKLTADPQQGLVRVFNASMDTPAVDVYVDGAAEPALSDAGYGERLEPFSLPAGTHDITIRAAGALASDKPLAEIKGATIAGNQLTMVVTLGLAGGVGDKGLDARLYTSDANGVTSGNTRVQFIQAAPDAPTYNVLLSNQAVAEGMTYKQAASVTLSADLRTVSAAEPSAEVHILGTDDLGRDHLARLMYAGQVSLGIGFLAASISILIGVMLGLITGFYGGVVDDIVNWVITTINSIPTLLLLLIIVAVFRPGPATLIIVLGLLGWTGTTRLVRGKTLSIREQEYIVGAQAIGSPVMRILTRHVLPNLLSLVIINLAIDIGSLILVESALSFLGFGIKPPTASWGAMLTDAQTFFTKGAHLVVFPGALISVTVLCLYIIGDGLRDAFDPTLRH